MANVAESRKLDCSGSQRYQTMASSGKQPQTGASAEGFSGVILEGDDRRFSLVDPDDPAEAKRKSGKQPKKVLHFSDGILEVYSSSEDEEEDDDAKNTSLESTSGSKRSVDPKTLGWIPWLVYYTWWLGSGLLGYCDFFGEKLAWGLGITSPKYYYELQEYERMKEEEEERKKRQGIEAYGWMPDAAEAKTDGVEMKEPETLSPTNLVDVHADRHGGGGTPTEAPNAPATVDFDPELQQREY